MDFENLEGLMRILWKKNSHFLYIGYKIKMDLETAMRKGRDVECECECSVIFSDFLDPKCGIEKDFKSGGKREKKV